MSNTIFGKLSFDRKIINWEEYLKVLTPIERIGVLNFKREDYFAPLGYGGINGSKLRQAIFLVNDFVKKGGTGKLISGASVKSPQLPMGTAVAKHFGLESLHVIGATKENTAFNHENVKMAAWFGAQFDIIKVGYNPVLQSRVRSIINDHPEFYYLHYGITTGNTVGLDFITKFHMIGANQTYNILDDIEDLVIPAGSCNSCISVMIGVLMCRPKNLKSIHLIGIGPSKIMFIYDRLRRIGEYLGINLLNFRLANFSDDGFLVNTESDCLDLYYYDLHKTGFTTYQDEVPFTYKGIEFHPTYEGKCFYYMTQKLINLFKDTTLFWIIGSKPMMKNMEYLKSELGEFPTSINLWK